MNRRQNERIEIKRLYEAALEIVDARNLYNIKQQLKKDSEESFNDYIKQNYDTQIYKNWWLEVQHSFAKANLNFLRFKKKIILRENDKSYEIAPPGYLLLAIVELEKMISDNAYLDDYKLTLKTTQSWPSIKYSKGLVDNGTDMHDFTKFDNKDAIEMLDGLWAGRQIISPTNLILKEASPINWKEIGFINSNSGKSTANAINKAMREKNINLRVKFPKNTKGAFIRLQQKSTE